MRVSHQCLLPAVLPVVLLLVLPSVGLAEVLHQLLPVVLLAVGDGGDGADGVVG